MVQNFRLATALLFLVCNLSYGQKTQNIRGTVIDQFTLAPLIGATIIVKDSTLTLGAITDATGNYLIKNVPIGRITLSINYVGYEPLIIPNMEILSGKELVQNISLQESTVNLNEVKVVYSRKNDKTVTNNEMAVLSSRPFNPEDTRKFAGSIGDPSRMAANFAGVVGANDSRNDIIIRGNSPNGLLWRLEGIDIPNPNHFGGLGTTGGPITMLNTNVIGKSDFFTGAFLPEYGNALSGIFDLDFRNGNPESFEHMAQVSFNGLEIGSEGPLNKKKKDSYVANYRYADFAMLGLDFDFKYHDLNFKLSQSIGKKGKLTLTGIGGYSKLAFVNKLEDIQNLGGPNNPFATQTQNLISKYIAGNLIAKYEHRFSSKTLARLSYGLSVTNDVSEVDSVSSVDASAFPSERSNFETRKHAVHLQLRHKFSSKFFLKVGSVIDVNRLLLSRTFFNTSPSYKLIGTDENTVLTQGYIQGRYRISDRLTAVGGLHYQHFNLNQTQAIEPRFTLQYKVSEKTQFAAAYGMHNQTLPVYLYFNKDNNGQMTNRNLDFTKSNHYVLAFKHALSAKWQFNMEAYYQKIANAGISNQSNSFSTLNLGNDFDVSNALNLINKGEGENYGIEFTLEHRFQNGYYVLANTSIFQSKYKGSDNIWRNTAFNNQYVFNVLGGKEFKLKKGSVIGINGKLIAVGGKWLTPIDVSASMQSFETVYQTEKAFSKLQQAFFKTDIRLFYRLNSTKHTFEFSVDLTNITNRKNIFQEQFNPLTGEVKTIYQQGFFPIPSIRWLF